MFFYSKEQVLDKNSYLLIKNYSNLISAYSLPMYLQHAKATFTLGISSCDWRDDQIRILQGTYSTWAYVHS